MAEIGEYLSEEPPTPLLDTVNFPIHMKNLNKLVWISLNCHVAMLLHLCVYSSRNR